MLIKMKINTIIMSILLGIAFSLNLLSMYYSTITFQKILQITAGWGTILILSIGFILPVFLKRFSFQVRFGASSSSLLMLIMYILFKTGFEATHEFISMYGFDIATSYMEIWLFICAFYRFRVIKQ